MLGSHETGLSAGLRSKVVGRLPPTEVGGKQDSCVVSATTKREVFWRLGLGKMPHIYARSIGPPCSYQRLRGVPVQGSLG